MAGGIRIFRNFVPKDSSPLTRSVISTDFGFLFYDVFLEMATSAPVIVTASYVEIYSVGTCYPVGSTRCALCLEDFTDALRKQ